MDNDGDWLGLMGGDSTGDTGDALSFLLCDQDHRKPAHVLEEILEQVQSLREDRFAGTKEIPRSRE